MPSAEQAGFSLRGLDASSLFLPLAGTGQLEELRDTLWRQRQRVLLALDMRLHASRNEPAFAAAMFTFRKLPEARRRTVMEYPPLRIWLQRAEPLTEFSRILDAALALNDPEQCQIQRYDVDPLLAQAAPPSFVFDDLERKREADKTRPYTTVFFADVFSIVMSRLEQVWPEMARILPWFVKTIVHLPELESRSCSAQRFAGVVLLSSGDDTLMMVEESLVHECGHQILYNIMELDPLVKTDAPKSFVLPWSGAERDAYGYFHATYIYLILALLMEKEIAHGPDPEQAAVRLGEILKGLQASLSDFRNADFFTPAGSCFAERMMALITDVIQRH